MACRASEMGDKVDDEVECDGDQYFRWHLHDVRADGLGGGMIQRVFVVLFHDGSLLPEGQNLQGASKCIQENSEEQQGTALEEAASIAR